MIDTVVDHATGLLTVKQKPDGLSSLVAVGRAWGRRERDVAAFRLTPLYYASDLSSATTGDKMKVDCGRF